MYVINITVKLNMTIVDQGFVMGKATICSWIKTQQNKGLIAMMHNA